MVREQRNGGPAGPPDDTTLLTAIAEMWQQVDPPPDDLVDGVLAAIAAEDLEFELLVLVETDALAGVRHSAPEEREDTGAWMLEYEGPDVRVYVRLTRIEDRTRLDGWVVPVKPLNVQLRADGQDKADDTVQESDIDEFGRFEFASVEPGLSRLTFTDPAGGSRPRVTPPFWI
ncbi:MAG: hypothetical protein ABWY19_12275 [Marmoricola sp.]